jgi:hypothetical protein
MRTRIRVARPQRVKLHFVEKSFYSHQQITVLELKYWNIELLKGTVISQILQKSSAYGHRKASYEATVKPDGSVKAHRLQINYLKN